MPASYFSLQCTGASPDTAAYDYLPLRCKGASSCNQMSIVSWKRLAWDVYRLQFVMAAAASRLQTPSSHQPAVCTCNRRASRAGEDPTAPEHLR